MLSRVADNIYWMHRYIERAENYARFMDVNYNLSLELPPELANQWKPLVVTTGDWKLYEELYGKQADKNKAIYFLGLDRNNPNSIFNCLRAARENARAVRPEITKEVWEQINHVYYFVKESEQKKRKQIAAPREFFTQIKKECQTLYGIFYATISRNDGWYFGKIGQMLERADKTSRVLDVKYHILLPTAEDVGSPIDLLQWSSLLKSVSAYDMYRRKSGKLTPGGISEFLIFDKAFPRSILHCLIQAEKALHIITGNPEGHSNAAEKHLGGLRYQLDFADIEDVFEKGLHEYMDEIQTKLNQVSEAIFKTFFSIDRVK